MVLEIFIQRERKKIHVIEAIMDNYGMDHSFQNGGPIANNAAAVGGGADGVFTDIKLEESGVAVPQREKLSYHLAARYGNVAVVQSYITKYQGRRKKINKLNRQELSALHYAVRYGHMDVINLLIMSKADINVCGADGAQPIHFAAKYFKAEKHVSLNVPKSELTTTNTDPLVLEVQQVEEGFTSGDKSAIDMQEYIPSAIQNEQVDDVISFLLKHYADVNAVDNYNQTPLNYAAVKGNVEALSLLLKCPEIDMEIADTSGGTALHNACSKGHTEAAKLLLLAGANLMACDHENMNPLHYAATGEGSKILGQIIRDIEKQGGHVGQWSLKEIINSQSNEKETILHLAIDTGHYSTCCLIIEKGANVNLCRKNFVSPLHLAARSGNLEIVKLLLASGADIEAQNAWLKTPLHRAAKYNRVEVVKYLLKKGSQIDAYDNDNKTPLYLAVQSGNIEMVDVLLQNQADITVIDIYEKNTIYCAAEENMVDVLKLLLEHARNLPYPSEFIDQSDRFENTALHIASMKGFKHVVELLLENNADIDCCNDEELTPLHLACINGNRKVAEILLKTKESIINDEDESGNAALHLAALNGHPKIIALLIDHGASVDPRNSLLWTPLDCASAKGFSKCVTILLERGAPIDSMDLASTTPLHLAAFEGFAEVVKVLLAGGADVTLRDHKGRNALDLAIENSHKETALLLIEHKEWLSLMRNRLIERSDTITSPMRQLIKKMPDAAHEVLNKCMKLTSHLPMDNPDYKVTFFYDFLDDTYNDWSPDHDEDIEEDRKSVTTADSNVVENEFENDANKLTPKVVTLLQKKKNHPLNLMCEYKRSKLLNHPLVLSLIYEKWQKFGRYVFYAKFSLYVLFLLFLTGYVLVTPPLLPREVSIANGVVCVRQATDEDRTSASTIVFFFIGKNVVLVMACFQLVLEFIQLFNRRLSYIADFTNWMEWSIYIMAIYFVGPTYDHLIDTDERCGGDLLFHISVGAVTIFLGWINLLLFIQKFPSLGIYVVMFTDVMRTFLKFSVTFLLFIVAFGLGFYTLLGDHLTFSNTGRSFMKTIVMMIGEFDYDNIFSDSNSKPPPVTWALFFLFVIIMTILLMNLMVGLAVDDIKGVLDMAVLSRVAMQVHLVMDVEKTLPARIRQKFVMKEKTVYPNKEFNWLSLMAHITRMDEIQEALNPTKSVSQIVAAHTENIHVSVNHLKQESNELKKQVRNIELMIERLLKHSNIVDNDDDQFIWN